MDQRLADALDFANYSQTLFNQKKLTYQKFVDSCIYYYNAGKFTINKELICYCNNLTNSAIILDDNNLPIKISDIKKFTKQITIQYNSALDLYHQEYEKIISQKNVEGIIDE